MPTAESTTTHETIERLATQAGSGIVGIAGRGRGGSGIVIAPGRVLTLARNLRREEVTLAFGEERREPGRVLGVDHDLGIALVEADTGESAVLRFSEASDAPTIGAPVFALADPRGRGLRVTSGAVTSSPRSLRGPRGRLLEGLIEHTAPLPRGSGGGALLDETGQVLGVNALRVDDGLILALPATSIRSRIEDLAAGRAPTRRRLGVAIVPPRAARRLRRAVGLPDRDGVLVRGVLEGSPAAQAGLERGDLIVALDGRPVESVDALFGALDAVPLEQPFNVSIVRGESERDLEVSLESQ